MSYSVCRSFCWDARIAASSAALGRLSADVWESVEFR